MTPFVFDSTAEALDQERQVIRWFKDNPPKNPKKLIKMLLSIYSQVPDFIQKSFCNVLLSDNTPNKLKALDQYIYEMDSVPKLIEQLKREGNHGMVIYKTAFYGISLKASANWLRKNDLTEWTTEQEDEIVSEALDAWMIENCVRHFKDKVVLFSQFGFSGVSRYLDVEMDDESWEKAKSLKMDKELALYMSKSNATEK